MLPPVSSRLLVNLLVLNIFYSQLQKKKKVSKKCGKIAQVGLSNWNELAMIQYFIYTTLNHECNPVLQFHLLCNFGLSSLMGVDIN